MLLLDISGGNLPVTVKIRESPTLASAGKMAIERDADNSFHIDSFFDVFTELSLDDGQSWTPANSAVHVSLVPNLCLQLECPPDFTAECPNSDPAFTGAAIVTDLCGSGFKLDFSDSETPGADCSVDHIVKVIRRTWTATDPWGASTNCTQTITVKDTTPPTLTGCPPSLTVQCLSEVPPRASVVASDNCDGSVQAVFDETFNGPPCNRTITRTWTATDNCGNAARCIQTITVMDNTAPVVQCPGDISLAADVGKCSKSNVAYAASATD